MSSNDNTQFVDPYNFKNKWDTQPYIKEKNLLKSSKQEKIIELAKKKFWSKNTENDNNFDFSLVDDFIESLNNKSGFSNQCS